MHLSLYRKYRPKVFSDVIDQEHITKILAKEVETNRIHHAYVFTGSRGTGKTTCAKILAKAINCLQPVNGNPCGECELCREIDNGSVLDIVEIDAASNTGVDNIRDLKEEAMFTPSRGKYRVFIIDEVHMLSDSAFNALLKILEEPPAHVVFILATTEIDEVLPTVLSRCQRFDFKRITINGITKRLKFVADKEGFSLTDDAAELIAKISDGAMRDALSILEQCSVYSETIDKETVLKAAGVANREYIGEILTNIKEGNLASCLKVLSSLYSEGKNLSSFIEEIALGFRDVMMLKCSPDLKDVLTCLPDEFPFYKEYAESVSLSFILEKLAILKDGLDSVEKSFNERVFAELMLVRLVNGADVLDYKPAKPEEKASAERPAKPKTEEPKAEKAPISKKGEQPNAVGGVHSSPKPADEKKDFAEWRETLEALALKQPILASFLDDSEAMVDEESLYVLTSNEFFHKMIRTGDNAVILLATVKEVTGKTYKLKVSTMQTKPSSSPLDDLIKRAEEEGIKVSKEN